MNVYELCIDIDLSTYLWNLYSARSDWLFREAHPNTQPSLGLKEKSSSV